MGALPSGVGGRGLRIVYLVGEWVGVFGVLLMQDLLQLDVFVPKALDLLVDFFIFVFV